MSDVRLLRAGMSGPRDNNVVKYVVFDLQSPLCRRVHCGIVLLYIDVYLYNFQRRKA